MEVGGEAISSLGLAVRLFVHELVAEAAVLQVGVVHRLLDKHPGKQKYQKEIQTEGTDEQKTICKAKKNLRKKCNLWFASNGKILLGESCASGIIRPDWDPTLLNSAAAILQWCEI
jgi:hypothetical protein